MSNEPIFKVLDSVTWNRNKGNNYWKEKDKIIIIFKL